jgi:hypothetical protein
VARPGRFFGRGVGFRGGPPGSAAIFPFVTPVFPLWAVGGGCPCGAARRAGFVLRPGRYRPADFGPEVLPLFGPGAESRRGRSWRGRTRGGMPAMWGQESASECHWRGCDGRGRAGGARGRQAVMRLWCAPLSDPCTPAPGCGSGRGARCGAVVISGPEGGAERDCGCGGGRRRVARSTLLGFPSRWHKQSGRWGIRGRESGAELHGIRIERQPAVEKKMPLRACPAVSLPRAVPPP